MNYRWIGLLTPMFARQPKLKQPCENVSAGAGLNCPELSVDRLTYADVRQAAEAQTALRERQCRGWAKLPLVAASANGREVHPDPVRPDRLHHAFILLPLLP